MPSFDFKINCLFCGEVIQEIDSKNVSRYKQVSVVKSTEMQQTILDLCCKRNDAWGSIVNTRIGGSINLWTQNARYHLKCYCKFREVTTNPSRGKPINDNCRAGFEALCAFIKQSNECQFALRDLKEKLREFSGNDVDLYGDYYLRDLLINHFKPNLVATNLFGKTIILTLKDMLPEELLVQNWDSYKCSSIEEERVRTVKAAAAIIKEDIQSQIYDTTVYPTFDDIKNGGEEFVPATLKIFTETLYKKRNACSSTKTNKKMQFLNQCMIYGCRPKSFISPVLLGLSVYLHRKVGSRHIIDLLNSIGITASYNEAANYIKCATEFADVHVEKKWIYAICI